jgi:hypothetical protein
MSHQPPIGLREREAARAAALHRDLERVVKLVCRVASKAKQVDPKARICSDNLARAIEAANLLPAFADRQYRNRHGSLVRAWRAA